MGFAPRAERSMSMKVQWMMWVAVSMVAGCYRAHGLPEDVRVSVSVMAQTGALPAVPAEAARVVVEDCTTGQRIEAVTGADGLAHFDAVESTCWNVTAVIDGFARSVLRAPVPLPGPIVFPLEMPALDEEDTLDWEIEFEGVPRGDETSLRPYRLQASVPGTLMDDYSLPIERVGGRAHAATLLRDRQALIVATTADDDQVVGMALVPFPEPEAGHVEATIAVPTDLPPLRTASVRVLLRAGGVYNIVNPYYALDRSVFASSPSGSEYQIGPQEEWAELQTSSPAGLEVGTDYRWFELPGTESWTPAMSGGSTGWRGMQEPCSSRRVSWGRIPLVDGATHRSEVPQVTARQVSGTSLDTLVIDYGGAGHRSFLAFRTAGEQPFEWTIEPFDTGVTHFEGLPPLPAGVADSVGLMERSVYVRFGVTAPSAASFAPMDPAELTVPWRIHEGFVIGQVSDFDESLAECEQVP
jgi:hypothetical protein